MRKYEYQLVTMPRGSSVDIENFLNEYGIEGWELCGIDYGCFVFKRKVKA